VLEQINGFELRARTQSMLRIKHQYDDLQNLLKSREDMVKMIVHDLRNPLQNISIGLELLGSIEYPREKQKQKLSQIYSSVKNLQELINDLLKMSLMEAGKFDLNPKKVYLLGLLRATISTFEAIANQKGQSLIIQCSEGSQQQVFVDVAIMQRALDNLLLNAIKFSPQNSKIIVNVECLTSGETKIQVIDSGPGVPDALQQKIFEKYEIGTLNPNVSQIGLGLAFCKLVVEAHGGAICVKNNQPNGAIFEITLPAVTTAMD
jgi:two-component system, sensor histidine kinase and response regulator